MQFRTASAFFQKPSSTCLDMLGIALVFRNTVHLSIKLVICNANSIGAPACSQSWSILFSVSSGKSHKFNAVFNGRVRIPVALMCRAPFKNSSVARSAASVLRPSESVCQHSRGLISIHWSTASSNSKIRPNSGKVNAACWRDSNVMKPVSVPPSWISNTFSSISPRRVATSNAAVVMSVVGRNSIGMAISDQRLLPLFRDKLFKIVLEDKVYISISDDHHIDDLGRLPILRLNKGQRGWRMTRRLGPRAAGGHRSQPVFRGHRFESRHRVGDWQMARKPPAKGCLEFACGQCCGEPA